MVPGRCALLIVNGYDRRGRFGPFAAAEAQAFPWIELCLERIARHTAKVDLRVLVWDNTWLARHFRVMRRFDFVTVFRAPTRPQQRSHPVALDLLLEQATDAEYVVTLDTDALPLRDDWLDALLDRLDSGAVLTGVYRDEMKERLRPFLHVSCLGARRHDLLRLPVSFARGMTQDLGQNLSLAVEKQEPGRGRLSPLWRSNVREAHFLMGGLYGDLVYHQGAGSRRARFHTSSPAVADEDERIRRTLRNWAFTDLERLTGILAGRIPNDLGLPLRSGNPGSRLPAG
jgi:hypothetical protein